MPRLKGTVVVAPALGSEAVVGQVVGPTYRAPTSSPGSTLQGLRTGCPVLALALTTSTNTAINEGRNVLAFKGTHAGEINAAKGPDEEVTSVVESVEGVTIDDSTLRTLVQVNVVALCSGLEA